LVQQQIAGAEDLVDADPFEIAHQRENLATRECFRRRTLKAFVNALSNRLTAPEAVSKPEHHPRERGVMVEHNAGFASGL
jgi:hypothetical protein